MVAGIERFFMRREIVTETDCLLQERCSRPILARSGNAATLVGDHGEAARLGPQGERGLDHILGNVP